MTKNTGVGHVPAELLRRYAAGEMGAGAQDVWWAVEVHLESCVVCRAQLREAVAVCSPATTQLLERVRVGLVAEVALGRPSPARSRWPAGTPWRWMRRWTRWWAAPALLARLGMTVLVVLAAVVLDLADRAHGAGGVDAGRFPSLVLLLAPVAPLLGVAAAWSRGLDPAHELVVASPRAGLDLVLRRTVTVLAVVIPVLAVAGWVVGASPVRWLLPCLAFTVGALALGEVVGLFRAATGLALGWVTVVVGPSLIVAPVAQPLLATASLPVWAVVTAVAVVVLVVVRRRAYTGLSSGR
jgi:hypothetical protein